MFLAKEAFSGSAVAENGFVQQRYRLGTSD